MFGLGTTELIIAGIIAVLLFGSRLPEVARSMGRSLTEFKKGMQSVTDDVKSSVYADPPNSIEDDRNRSYDEGDEPNTPAFVPPEDEVETVPPNRESNAVRREDA